MWTLFQCKYCTWNWKEKTDGKSVGEMVFFAVCNTCMFREGQTPSSILETRKQIAFLFPRSSRERSDSFTETGAFTGAFRGDVSLYAQDSQGYSPQKPIKAHLLVLAMKSPVFYEMIQSMRDHKLFIKHSSVNLLRAMVKFLYTGEISFSAQPGVTHGTILRFSHEYLISDLKSTCVVDLLSHVTEENLCMVLKLARIYREPDLEKEAMQFFARQRRKLKKATLERLFRLAHEYELDELKCSCEIELLGKINRRNLVSMLDVSIQGKGLLLLISTVVFLFLQKDAFGGYGHFSITGSGVDVLRTLLAFGHHYLGFRCLDETHIESLRGPVEIDLKERIAVKNLFFMVTLPWQKRAGVFTVGALRFVSRHCESLCRTGLTSDLLKFAHDYKISDLEKACELAICQHMTSQHIFQIFQPEHQHHAPTLMAGSRSLDFLCTHHYDHGQLKPKSCAAIGELLLLSSCNSRRLSSESPGGVTEDDHDENAPQLTTILNYANCRTRRPPPPSTTQAVRGKQLKSACGGALSSTVFKKLGCFKRGRKRKRT